MPNNCYNKITLNGDPEEVKKAFSFMGTADDPLSFTKIIPYPAKYEQRDQDRVKLSKEKFTAKYPDEKDGFNSGGYEWCTTNWGTKWDAYDQSKDDNSISFYTAWSPPYPIISKIALHNPNVRINYEYQEPGMCFAGSKLYEAKAHALHPALWQEGTPSYSALWENDAYSKRFPYVETDEDEGKEFPKLTRKELTPETEKQVLDAVSKAIRALVHSGLSASWADIHHYLSHVEDDHNVNLHDPAFYDTLKAIYLAEGGVVNAAPVTTEEETTMAKDKNTTDDVVVSIKTPGKKHTAFKPKADTGKKLGQEAGKDAGSALPGNLFVFLFNEEDCERLRALSREKAVEEVASVIKLFLAEMAKDGNLISLAQIHTPLQQLSKRIIEDEDEVTDFYGQLLAAVQQPKDNDGKRQNATPLPTNPFLALFTAEDIARLKALPPERAAEEVALVINSHLQKQVDSGNYEDGRKLYSALMELAAHIVEDEDDAMDFCADLVDLIQEPKGYFGSMTVSAFKKLYNEHCAFYSGTHQMPTHLMVPFGVTVSKRCWKWDDETLRVLALREPIPESSKTRDIFNHRGIFNSLDDEASVLGYGRPTTISTHDVKDIENYNVFKAALKNPLAMSPRAVSDLHLQLMRTLFGHHQSHIRRDAQGIFSVTDYINGGTQTYSVAGVNEVWGTFLETLRILLRSHYTGTAGVHLAAFVRTGQLNAGMLEEIEQIEKEAYDIYITLRTLRAFYSLIKERQLESDVENETRLIDLVAKP